MCPISPLLSYLLSLYNFLSGYEAGRETEMSSDTNPTGNHRRGHPSRHLQADCREPGSAPEPSARRSSMGYLFNRKQ